MHAFLNVIIFAALGAVLTSADVTVWRWQYWAILGCCIAASINALTW